ncbi:MAG: HvfC/BufC family peptide modification chaperone [Sulfuriferula sp.]
MHSLRDLQQDFLTTVFSGEKNALAQHLVGTESERSWRADIYRNNTFSNLRNTLESTYPVIVKLVGVEFFRHAAQEYILQYPSVSGDLHLFGEVFGAFLASFPPVEQLPYLPDVARLEWLCHKAYFAADHTPLALDRLMQVPPTRYVDLQFKLNPACTLFESAFPADRIWQINQDQYTGEQSLDLSSGGATALVTRVMYRVTVSRMARSEWCALQALSTGLTFATACDVALRIDPEFDLVSTLHRWVNDSILVDFSLAT